MFVHYAAMGATQQRSGWGCPEPSVTQLVLVYHTTDGWRIRCRPPQPEGTCNGGWPWDGSQQPTGRAEGSQAVLHPVGMGGTKVRTRPDREVVPRFFPLVFLQVKVRAPLLGTLCWGRSGHESGDVLFGL